MRRARTGDEGRGREGGGEETGGQAPRAPKRSPARLIYARDVGPFRVRLRVRVRADARPIYLALPATDFAIGRAGSRKLVRGVGSDPGRPRCDWAVAADGRKDNNWRARAVGKLPVSRARGSWSHLSIPGPARRLADMSSIAGLPGSTQASPLALAVAPKRATVGIHTQILVLKQARRRTSRSPRETTRQSGPAPECSIPFARPSDPQHKNHMGPDPTLPLWPAMAVPPARYLRPAGDTKFHSPAPNY
jgi:hypothetical protein